MGKRIVILGAGFGGLAASTILRKQLGAEHSIVVIDRKDYFMMGLVNLWILAGSRKLDESKTPLGNLNSRGIEYINDEVVAIETALGSVRTKVHGVIEYDFLIIALGSELAPERIPGFVGRGYSLYEPSDVPRLRDALVSLKKGRVAITIMGMPYKCPPAPFEASMIIEHMARESTHEIHIDIYSPAAIAMPAAGPEVSSTLVGNLKSRGITFHPSHKLESVSDGELTFAEGRKADYDVLAGVPPHKVPEVIARSDLAGQTGWINVDRHTMRTLRPNVFAIGDVADIKVTSSLSVPKAGIFAEGQARAVALQIVEELSGRKPEATFDGRGFCFVENGGRLAGMVAANFFADSGPDVLLEPPSELNYEKKQEFERSRLTEWLQ